MKRAHSEASYKRQKAPCTDNDFMKDVLSTDVRSLFSEKTALDKECRWLLCPFYDQCDLDGWGDQSNDREYARDLCDEIISLSDLDSQVSFAWSVIDQMRERDSYIPTKRQISALENMKEDL